MPSGNVDKPVIEDNRDGTVSIRYDPREEGLHELAIKYNGESVVGKLNHITVRNWNLNASIYINENSSRTFCTLMFWRLFLCIDDRFLLSCLGSPFKFHVDSISSGYVTAYGPGLTHGVTGEPALFTISTKGAGAGGLSMVFFVLYFECDQSDEI